MRGAASACGSATVVNAIASGKGAAFAIDLRVRAEVELSKGRKGIEGRVGETEESPKLIELCVQKVLEREKALNQYGGEVKTSTDLPIAVGLSSSSAAANATILATYDALGKEPEPEDAIDLGIDAAFEAGTTVTGAFDDAAASFLGGGAITDNRERKLLKRFDMDPKLQVLVYLPRGRSYTAAIDVERTELVKELVEAVHQLALDGNVFEALTLNGLVYSSILNYDPKPALDALEAGAEGAGLTGTGPAVVAVAKKERVEKILGRWKSKSTDVIVTKPSEEGARVEK